MGGNYVATRSGGETKRGALWFTLYSNVNCPKQSSETTKFFDWKATASWVVPLLHSSSSDWVTQSVLTIRLGVGDTHLFYYRSAGWLGMCVELGGNYVATRSDTYVIQPLAYINEN